MRVKQHYEEYWESKGKGGFGDYERNAAIVGWFKKGERVLDVGCGSGEVGEWLQRKVGAEVVGVDVSEGAVRQARKRGVTAKVVNVEGKLPFKKESFDTVFWGDNVEHLFSPEETLAEIRRVLRRGGRLILSCPNMGYWRYRIYYLLQGRPADTEWTGKRPWGWSHIRFFNLRILREFLEEGGFKVRRVAGVNRRQGEKWGARVWPAIWGMILVVEVAKR